MIYLLDVNALLALGFGAHQFHARVAAWVRDEESPHLATCSITELGFVRVLSQVPAYGLNVAQARTLLRRIKKSPAAHFSFFADRNDISHLPAWAKVAKQVTDGHLLGLAATSGAALATLDENLPGAWVIP